MAEEIKPPAENAGPPSSSVVNEEPVDGPGDEALDLVLETKEEFSSDDIDTYLKLQDPEFDKQLSDIGKDKDLSATEAEIDADTAALHDEIEKWRSGSKLKRGLYGFMPFLPRLSLFYLRLRFKTFAFFISVRIRTQNFAFYLVKEGRKSAQAWLVHEIQSIQKSIQQRVKNFKGLSRKLKLAFFGLVLLLAASLGVVYLAWQGKLLPTEQELFVRNLADHANGVYEVNKEEGYENFYDNIRATPNMLLIEKMVVNIKASTSSGPNPMLALDFFVEGLNPDVIIEVKDREAFFKDLIQRTIETFSFDELSGTEGKKRLIDTLLRDFNRNLTQGGLRGIKFKTIILKP